jgi:hypothetical protein
VSKRSRLVADLVDAQAEVSRLQQVVADERWSRICAQRGLVREIREHCRVPDHRIGYDPDQDPSIVELVKAGKLPGPYDPKAEVVAEIAAERAVG